MNPKFFRNRLFYISAFLLVVGILYFTPFFGTSPKPVAESEKIESEVPELVKVCAIHEFPGLGPKHSLHFAK